MDGNVSPVPRAVQRHRRVAVGIVLAAAALPLFLVLIELWICVPGQLAKAEGIEWRSAFDLVPEVDFTRMVVATGIWVGASVLITVAMVARLRRGEGRKLGAPFSAWRVTGSGLVTFSVVSVGGFVPHLASFLAFFPLIGYDIAYPLSGRLAILGCLSLLASLVMLVISTVVNVRARGHAGYGPSWLRGGED